MDVCRTRLIDAADDAQRTLFSLSGFKGPSPFAYSGFGQDIRPRKRIRNVRNKNDHTASVWGWLGYVINHDDLDWAFGGFEAEAQGFGEGGRE